MRKALIGSFMVASVLLAGCGEDGKPDRTIAFLRTTPIAVESQAAFLAELEDAGWADGDNLTILNPDPASGFTDEDDASSTVEAFVEEGADLVVALSTSAAMVAAAAAPETPVVTLANDPVASGLVSNARRPEANLTGVSFRVPADRTIDVARLLVGTDATIGLLWPDGDVAAAPIVAATKSAATALGVSLVDAGFTGDADVPAAVEELEAGDADVVLLANAPTTVRSFAAIEAALGDAGLAAVANTEQNTFAAVVLAPDVLDAYRQLGRQAGRILDGTAVADVPVEDPGSFRLVVRTAIADRLGIDVAPELLDQADVVVDE
jgi:putative ABC transport system substrate-binding protein